MFLPMSLGLFLSGAAVAFFLAFDKVLAFLLSFNRMMGIDPDLRINEWMSFALLLPLGFGASFQLPLVMLFLERIGLVTVKTYLSSWRMAVVAIFILALVLNPSGDPASMCLMACPLTVLYFGGVLLCKVFPRGRQAA
jgi:sec-independent protein translocase protein TatC